MLVLLNQPKKEKFAYHKNGNLRNGSNALLLLIESKTNVFINCYLKMTEPTKDKDSNRSILSRIITAQSPKEENRKQSENRAPKSSKPTGKD